MFAVNSVALSSTPHHLDPYDLAEVVTLPYHRLLVGLFGVAMLCIGRFWELRGQMCGRISSLCEAFRPGAKETFGEKMRAGTIHGAAAQQSLAVPVFLDPENLPTDIALMMEPCPGGTDNYTAGAVVKPAGGSTVSSRPTAAGSGANSGAIRKQKANGRRRTENPNRRDKPQRRNGRDDGDDGGKQPRKGNSQFNVVLGLVIRTFACPFCKLDPERYFPCATATLSRIPDVWQHILRKHVLSVNNYCARCFSDFDDVAQLRRHEELQNCVQIAGPEHLFHQDVARLAPIIRGLSRVRSEEAKWYWIWDILFPGRAAPPSPYVETLRELVDSVVSLSNTPRFVRRYPEEVEATQWNSLLGNLGNGPQLLSLGLNQAGMTYPGMNPQGMNQFGVYQPGTTQLDLYALNFEERASTSDAELFGWEFANNNAMSNHDDAEYDDFAEQED